MSIGENIKRIAEEKKMSVYKVMKTSKVSPTYFYDLVKGNQNNPSVEIAQRIAKTLDVTVDELLQ